MYTKSTIQKLLAVIVLSIVLIISSNTVASAQRGGEEGGLIQSGLFTDASTIELIDVPGGPGLVMVSPFEFRPYNPDVDKVKFVEAALYNPISLPSNSAAPLTLPHSASLTKLTLYFYDDYVPQDMRLILYRSAVNGIISPVTSISPTGMNTGINYLSSTTFTPGSEVIDNRNYSYFLLAYIPGGGSNNLALVNVRIDYAYTTSLPVVMH